MQRNFASNNPFDIFVQAREHYKRTTMKNLEHNAPIVIIYLHLNIITNLYFCIVQYSPFSP